MSYVMVLEGLGQDEPSSPMAPALVQGGSTALEKVTGFVIFGWAAFVVWDMFQPGPGRPGMTIAGLGYAPGHHREFATFKRSQAEANFEQADKGFARGDCVHALDWAGQALLDIGRASGDAIASEDRKLRAETDRAAKTMKKQHEAYVRACARKR